MARAEFKQAGFVGFGFDGGNGPDRRQRVGAECGLNRCCNLVRAGVPFAAYADAEGFIGTVEIAFLHTLGSAQRVKIRQIDLGRFLKIVVGLQAKPELRRGSEHDREPQRRVC